LNTLFHKICGKQNKKKIVDAASPTDSKNNVNRREKNDYSPIRRISSSPSSSFSSLKQENDIIHIIPSSWNRKKSDNNPHRGSISDLRQKKFPPVHGNDPSYQPKSQFGTRGSRSKSNVEMSGNFHRSRQRHHHPEYDASYSSSAASVASPILLSSESRPASSPALSPSLNFKDPETPVRAMTSATKVN